MSDLILLRHGETSGESSIRFYGATDIPLSDFGRRQMECAGNSFAGRRFATVITSPLQRSKEGAVLALDGTASPGVTVVEDFREIDFGDWEGLTREEIAERDPDRYREWMEHNRLEGFPGGDLRDAFFNRIRKAALEIFNRAELPALAVLHKGVIKGVLSGLLDRPLDGLHDISIELGSITRLSKASGTWELTGTNEVEHLGEYRKVGS